MYANRSDQYSDKLIGSTLTLQATTLLSNHIHMFYVIEGGRLCNIMIK
jgi:hypothetical protein